MYGRWCNTVVICFWFAAMSWLAAEKILPALFGGDPPDYQAALKISRARPDRWRIKWKERSLGFSASQTRQRPGGGVELRSIVRFEQLPVKSIAAELFGPLSALVEPLFAGERDFELEMLIATQMLFDNQRRLRWLHTTVDLADRRGFLVVDGQVQASGKLFLAVSLDDGTSSSDSSRIQVLQREIDLPPDALISDSLTPRPELKNLSLGQTWTFPVYRAFPPNSPVQIVRGKVQQHEIIFWDDRDVETMLVIYRSAAGSGINMSGGPLAKEWIRRDGSILRREVSLSGLQLRFERLPESTHDVRTEWLDADQHPRLWNTRAAKVLGDTNEVLGDTTEVLGDPNEPGSVGRLDSGWGFQPQPGAAR